MSSDILPDISPHLARTDPGAMEEFNRLLIAQYLAGNGRLTGQFEHVPVLLLTTVGTTTGRARLVPKSGGGRDRRSAGGAGGASAPTPQELNT